MRLFNCSHCGQLVYFENSHCEKCGYELGFLAADLLMYPLVPGNNASLFSLYGNGDDRAYTYCHNHQYQVCNWLVPADHPTGFCEACNLNRIIPDLGKKEYLERWQKIEFAKHRLIYTLLRMQLPFCSKQENPDLGLSFDFIADGGSEKVFTGHAHGHITLNIAEADDIERELTRRAMDEVYRTVLGHFRHEIGHYYWDRLIAGNPDLLEQFRAIFGDEQRNYQEALQQHYKQGAPIDWGQHFISAYASSHPWEDWAECWAHYLHILDTLETAYAFGLHVQPCLTANRSFDAAVQTDPYTTPHINQIIDQWLPLTYALNSINRSMGLTDLYPFILNSDVLKKLAFIHTVYHHTRSGHTNTVS